MAALDLSIVPEEHRDLVLAVIDSAFGTTAREMSLVTGGWSGALTYRVDATDGPYLVRVEVLPGAMRNPYQYECMRIAADAGIAPPVRHLDAEAGVVVMGFVTQRPLSEHPGGSPGATRDAGRLLTRLHETTPFQAHGNYFDNLDRMFAFLRRVRQGGTRAPERPSGRLRADPGRLPVATRHVRVLPQRPEPAEPPLRWSSPSTRPRQPTRTSGRWASTSSTAAFARGELVGGTAAGTIAFAKTMLRTFLESLAAPDLDESLRVVSLG